MFALGNRAQSRLPGCTNSIINLKHTPVFSFARCVEVDYVIYPCIFFVTHFGCSISRCRNISQDSFIQIASKPFAAATLNQCVWWLRNSRIYACLNRDLLRSYVLSLYSCLQPKLPVSWKSPGFLLARSHHLLHLLIGMVMVDLPNLNHKWSK